MQKTQNFLYENSSLLFFGFLLAYFSAYGQTFLLSLYIPELSTTFSLSKTGISSLYAIATLSSAFLLPWVGRRLDTVPLIRFTILVLLGFALACLTLSLAIHPAMIVLGFFGLRFCGQGLMSHVAISTMARAFEANRGKALSFATLGYPISKATVPLVIAVVISSVGWRASLRWEALSILIFLIPLVVFLLLRQKKELLYPQPLSQENQKKQRNPYRLLQFKAFWIIAPPVFILGFLNTAIFFFQFSLAEARDWDATFVAGSIGIYALAGATSILITGPLVDRFSAKQLFPYILFLYIIAVVLLATVQSQWIYPVALVFMALSNGFGNTTSNALYAEVFGVDIIGTVRSLFTTVMVFSTALGPLFFGFLLDWGWTFATVFWGAAVILVAIIIWNWIVPIRNDMGAF